MYILVKLLGAARPRQARSRDERAHRANALGDGLGARRTRRRAGLTERELVEAARVPRRIPVVVAIVARVGRRENAQLARLELDGAIITIKGYHEPARAAPRRHDTFYVVQSDNHQQDFRKSLITGRSMGLETRLRL